MSKEQQRQLVLASTSPFRRELLVKLAISFDTADPSVDETALEDENPEELVTRLAHAKAKAVSADFEDALIIGSDQVAVIDGEILGKPGNHERAMQQLKAAAGRLVTFYTGLCLLDTATGRSEALCEPFSVHFRQLSESQINHYLVKEEPYNCAGSFKSEGLGIALFRKLEGDDPNTLIGLPLIRLVELLEKSGIEVL
ncbi:Maf family protein [Solemya velum gill symbiont]|uniref:Maf family protein n=1 Tax=Solemya velum gill symbiont TaxID=2340 RepID=UPI0009963A24|nr:Maf family protein [Solemya velum gill symbiont]OOY50083.1 septum formation protein Maf [Solemya velum gill symbiont]OOY54360.1 septum formation protein Maf [Solemya velum gill symbiont]OOY54687.1 septum formation protein Maf [Solemya velum gill symbiont]OOY59080.1 septum formation protein Maf [Solemya velum gill symbiont]OOY62624.1 septum formation protein Maf [Solemya velum gill symbiont]